MPYSSTGMRRPGTYLGGPSSCDSSLCLFLRSSSCLVGLRSSMSPRDLSRSLASASRQPSRSRVLSDSSRSSSFRAADDTGACSSGLSICSSSRLRLSGTARPGKRRARSLSSLSCGLTGDTSSSDAPLAREGGAAAGEPCAAAELLAEAAPGWDAGEGAGCFFLPSFCMRVKSVSASDLDTLAPLSSSLLSNSFTWLLSSPK
mmetsp:Transcript_53393/g.134425  ORF Transcript_53393/g.134425 Transcript_53393/m.134425 type:complete len:203 (-) Transcript_53393:106-714(-)